MKKREILAANKSIIAIHTSLPNLVLLQVKQYTTEFTKHVPIIFAFNKSYNPPHISLYLAAFPQSNKDKVLDVLHVAPFTPINVSFGNPTIDEGGFVKLQCTEGRALMQNLHEKVVELVNPLREDTQRSKYETLASDLNPTLVKLIKEYSSPQVMINFDPHLAIARINIESKEEAQDYLNTNPLTLSSFIINGLLIVKSERDDFFRSEKDRLVLDEFSFSKQQE